MANDRSKKAGKELYFAFKKAFDTYKAYLVRGEHLSAFVVGFSIYEDRLTACHMLAKDISEEARATKFLAHKAKVNYLKSRNHLSTKEAESWLDFGGCRNAIIHGAMWDVNAVSDVDCRLAIAFARKADKLSRKLRKEANDKPSQR